MQGLQNFSKKLSGFSAKALVCLVRFYRLFLSGIFGGSCRFEPSCSKYAEDALQKHPPIQAMKLILIRLLQCRPGGAYGFDPVPQKRCAHE